MTRGSMQGTGSDSADHPAIADLLVVPRSSPTARRGETPATVPSPPDASRRSRSYRGEIEGLRAIAILVIVAYHAGVPGFSGGFVGVDIFFVISGYLITRNLLGQSSRSGRINFPEFWARRVRRLVPGLGLMVAVTLLASLLIVAPFDMLRISGEGAASALYVSNIVFGNDAQNYFAPSINKSPFLHTWSLGVEEQFYLLWPFLIFGVALIGRRRRDLDRRVAALVLTAVVVSSLLLSVRWTGEGSSWAFFSLPTRAWEFALGGLLASVVLRVSSRVMSWAAGLSGLALMAFATVTLSDSTPYPGWRALVPVVGAALVILSGQIVEDDRPTAVVRGLGVAPMAWFGRLSYSWYLWHWPFIVLAVLAFNNDSIAFRTFAVGASLPAAYLAFRFVENPIRFGKLFVRSPRRTYLLGLVITLAVLGVAGSTWLLASRSTPTSFTQAKNAAFKNFFANCTNLSTSDGIHYCAGGDLQSSTVVTLFGDSHAGTWFNAMSQVASRQRLKLVMFAHPGCPSIPVVVRPLPNGPVDTSQCLALQRQGTRLLSELRPKVVVLAQHDAQYLGLILDHSGAVPSTTEQVQLWRKAFSQFLDQTTAMGIAPAIILDNPTLPYYPEECVSRTGSIAACEPTRQTALTPSKPLIDAELSVMAARKSKIPAFAPSQILCNAAGCPLEIHNQLIYADMNHLFFGATKMMEPEISILLTSALRANH